MAKESILKRGFKAKAEKLATEYREQMNIHACAPLCAFELAKHLKIETIKATEFLTTKEDIDRLSGAIGESCEWSALTMVCASGNKIIIYNPFNSEGRQQSDVMHELAHIICEHKHKERDKNGAIPFGLRDYDHLQEEEAKHLGSILQLSSPCLLWAAKRKMTVLQISDYFNASTEMVKFRLNTTGIARRTKVTVN